MTPQSEEERLRQLEIQFGLREPDEEEEPSPERLRQLEEEFGLPRGEELSFPGGNSIRFRTPREQEGFESEGARFLGELVSETVSEVAEPAVGAVRGAIEGAELGGEGIIDLLDPRGRIPVSGQPGVTQKDLETQQQVEAFQEATGRLPNALEFRQLQEEITQLPFGVRAAAQAVGDPLNVIPGIGVLPLGGAGSVGSGGLRRFGLEAAQQAAPPTGRILVETAQEIPSTPFSEATGQFQQQSQQLLRESADDAIAERATRAIFGGEEEAFKPRRFGLNIAEASSGTPSAFDNLASAPTTGQLLPDPQDFQTQMDVAFQPNVARRIGEFVGQTPAGGILRVANPSAAATRPVPRAGIVRAMLKEEGAQQIENMMSFSRAIGDSDDIFGTVNRNTGLLEEGAFRGRSVNQLAENPTREGVTGPAREYLDRMSQMETAILDFYRRNGIDIAEVATDDIERYAGRIHVGIIDSAGEVVTTARVGRGGGLTGRTGAEQFRSFRTVREAQDAGFIPLNYEDSLRARARAAWNRVVDKRTTDWVRANLPDDVDVVEATRDLPRGFREGTLAESFPKDVFSGNPAAVQQVRQDISNLLRNDEVFLPMRAINGLNAIQRIFALAGDASPFAIQLLATAFRHPIAYARSGNVFATQLVRAFRNPRAARQFHNALLDANRPLLQRHRSLITSRSGLEFTEALGRGGFLGPESFLGKLKVTAPLKPFQEAFESTMDAAGIYLAEGMEHIALGDPVRMNALDDYINQMRGLTSSSRIGVSAQQRVVESAILLAPRYRRATASLLTAVFQGGLRGRLAQRAYAQLVAGMTMLYMGLTIGLGAAQGKSSEQITNELKQGLDPTSSRFMLWRIGGQLVGPGSKFVSDFRLISRMISDPASFADITSGSPLARWVRGQLAAVPSTAWDVLEGRDYIGEPVGGPLNDPKTYLNLGRRLAENFMPLWVQSASFDGGSLSDRAVRGSSDFFGLRSFPEGANDILDGLAFNSYGERFRELEPYQQDDVREIGREQLTQLQQQQVERGQELAEYFQSLDIIEQERLDELNALVEDFQAGAFGRIRSREARNKLLQEYLQNNTLFRGRRIQANVDREFSDEDLNDPDPNIRALAGYFQLFDRDLHPELYLKSDNIIPEAFDRAEKRYMASLQPEQRNYVLRNLNRREIPQAILDVMRTYRRGSAYRNMLDQISRSEGLRGMHRRATESGSEGNQGVLDDVNIIEPAVR